MVEQVTVNHWVAGSSPARGAKIIMPLYNKDNPEPYKLSRARIENFCNCPKCFYREEKLGISKPSSFPFNLNNAVDELLKEEFDYYRDSSDNHPYIKDAGIDAKPFSHPEIEDWRTRNKGVGYLDENTNFYIYGLLDDVWINTKTDQLIVVDYKATSKDGEVSLDAPWQISYKRQVEIYQWLLRKNGFDVQDTAYFVYCNAIRKNIPFENKLNFKVKILGYKGDDSWIPSTINKMKSCLDSDEAPSSSKNCEYCRYVIKANL